MRKLFSVGRALLVANFIAKFSRRCLIGKIHTKRLSSKLRVAPFSLEQLALRPGNGQILSEQANYRLALLELRLEPLIIAGQRCNYHA